MSVKFLRLYKFLLRPSIFQVREEITSLEEELLVEDTSEEDKDISGWLDGGEWLPEKVLLLTEDILDWKGKKEAPTEVVGLSVPLSLTGWECFLGWIELSLQYSQAVHHLINISLNIR